MDAQLEAVTRLIADVEARWSKRFDDLDQRLDRLEQKIDHGFAKDARVLREQTLAVKALTFRQAPHRSSRR